MRDARRDATQVRERADMAIEKADLVLALVDPREIAPRVHQAQQEERFAERAADPLKRWKLSPIDLMARTHYAEYGRARDAMLKTTHTANAPWALVDFNDQKRGRLTLIRHLLDALPDTRVPETPIELPLLKYKPARETFDGPLKPLADFAAD